MGNAGYFILIGGLMAAVPSAPAQTLKTLFSFGDNTGDMPVAAPVIGGGVLYGTTFTTVYALHPPSPPARKWSEEVLYTFPPIFGQPQGNEEASLAIGKGGELYGTTWNQGASAQTCSGLGCGTVFMLTPPPTPGGTWTQTTLYNFGNSPDGAYPYAGLTLGQDGTLYGTTTGGGSSACGCGTVFSLTPPSAPGGAWTETVLYSFGGPAGDGAYPSANLLIGGDGSLYGTTSDGGVGDCNDGCGTAFRLAPPAAPGGAWTETVLYRFTGSESGGPDGSFPGPLILAQDGTLYGTTSYGGIHGRGTVFELAPPSAPGGGWIETVLHSFSFADGQVPTGLIAGRKGVLYGTTKSGGVNCGRKQSCGTVFQMTPPAAPGGAWKETVLFDFSNIGSQGAHPLGGVVMSTGGALYGTTEMGGANGEGMVFKLVP